MNFDRFRKRILLIYKYYNEKERMVIWPSLNPTF
jgi:hypothetical protein